MGKNACVSSQMSLLSGAFCTPRWFLEAEYVFLAQCPSCVCLPVAEVEWVSPRKALDKVLRFLLEQQHR